jgi:hypothetical protein
MPQLAKAADQVRENRKLVSADNPFIAAQEAVSEQVVKSLDAWRETTEKFSESMFLAIYGSPVLQAAVGVNPESARPRRPGKSLMHRERREKRIAELKSQITKGGLIECTVRGLLYAGAPRGTVDERAFEALRRIRKAEGERLTMAQFKATVPNGSSCCAGAGNRARGDPSCCRPTWLSAGGTRRNPQCLSAAGVGGETAGQDRIAVRGR